MKYNLFILVFAAASFPGVISSLSYHHQTKAHNVYIPTHQKKPHLDKEPHETRILTPTHKKRENTDATIIDSQNANKKIYGVNLGGWLVTEPYITPSLYDHANSLLRSSEKTWEKEIVDELHFADYLGYNTAFSILRQHVDTWYTETDIQKIALLGLNLVRVPIGYWAWKDISNDMSQSTYLNGQISYSDTFINVGQLEKMRELLSWCQKYGVKAMIDLHGVPGSQNGFDNSGERNFYDSLRWLQELENDLANSNSTSALTVEILNSIFDEFITNNQYGDTVMGVQLVNEPFHWKVGSDKIIMFYSDMIRKYKRVQNMFDNTTPEAQIKLILHDAFEPLGFWNSFFTPAKKDILIDHHYYQCFSDWDLNKTDAQREKGVLAYGKELLSEQPHHPSFVGEFSAAIDDCATYLNGFGVGSRYDGTYYHTTKFESPLKLNETPLGTCVSHLSIDYWPEEYKRQTKNFIRSQLETYEKNSAGWIFWCWKTESAIAWDFERLVAFDIVPRNFKKLDHSL
ncbi:hypothetical protein ACO0RG_000685 [Hanseniaspora osmophila]